MLCNKCNSEIPEGAKFCIVCGEPVKKTRYCRQCGSELLENTKFCIVCGTKIEEEPAVNSSMQAVSAKKEEPKIENDINEDIDFEVPVIAPVIEEVSQAFGSFDMDAAVSPDENNGADSAVSHSAKAPSDVTISVFDGNKPKPDNHEAYSVPKKQTSYGGPSDDISKGYVPPYDPNKTRGNSESPNVVSNAPVAVIKKSRKKPVIITIVIILVLALIAGAVFCFTNSATVLSTFMGKANYGAMVEGNSLKKMNEELDKSSISGSIKITSELYSALGSLALGNFNGRAVVSENMLSGNTVNMSALIPAFNSIMKETCGTNSATVAFEINAELSDGAKSALAREYGMSADEVSKLLENINGSKFNFGATSGESSAAFKASADIKGLKTDVKILCNSEGKTYIVFPFASAKALMADTGEVNSEKTASLELDGKEIERLIGEVIDIYIEAYKQSTVTMENGELSVSGVSASGKLITADFSKSRTEKLISDICKKVANDSYLKGKLTEYLNSIGTELSDGDLEDTIKDMLGDIDNSALRSKILVDNAGNVLAKSYELRADGETVYGVSYVDGKNGAFEEKNKNGVKVSVKTESQSNSAGKSKITITDSQGNEAKADIKYDGLKSAKFCGKDIKVGTFDISVSVSEEFAKDYNIPNEAVDALNNSPCRITLSVSGKTLNTVTEFKSEETGSITVKCDITAEANTEDLSEPSETIDVTALSKGGELGEDERSEYIALLEEMRDKISSQNAGEAGDAAVEYINALIDAAGKISESEINGLAGSIRDNANEITDFAQKYNVNDKDLRKQAVDIHNRYAELYSELANAYSESDGALSYEQYSGFKDRAKALDAEKDALEKKYKIKAGLIPDFTEIKADKIVAVLGEYKGKLDAITNDSEMMSKIEADSVLKGMYDECSEIYTNAYNSAMDAYKDLIKGEIDNDRLNSARETLEQFITSFEELEKAVG